MKAYPLPLSAVALTLAFFAPKAARADERTRAAQDALTARGFFFGAPDGQPGATTSEAVRRFQIRQGLPVSGELDEVTVGALGLRPAPTPAATAETDRDFLRQNGLAPADTASPTPSPVVSTPPAPKPTPRAAAPTRPAPAVRPVAPPRAPQNVFTNVPPAAPAGAITPVEATRFLRRFLTAGAGDDVAAEVACYAPEVEYFNQGRQSRRFITRDQHAYRRRWPFRRYELLDEPEVARDGTVRYRLRYEVQSPARVNSGETRGEVTLRRTLGDASGLEITAIRERARSD